MFGGDAHGAEFAVAAFFGMPGADAAADVVFVGFEEGDGVAFFLEFPGGGEAGDTAADDDDGAFFVGGCGVGGADFLEEGGGHGGAGGEAEAAEEGSAGQGECRIESGKCRVGGHGVLLCGRWDEGNREAVSR